jgi:hypothetical protein
MDSVTCRSEGWKIQIEGFGNWETWLDFDWYELVGVGILSILVINGGIAGV